MTSEEAKEFARKHVEVWNRRDLDDILDLYSSDVVLESPEAMRLTGDGTIRGKDDLRKYFAAGFEKYPDLHFSLVNVLLGVRSVTLYFTSINERLVAEVLFVDDRGKVERVVAHYAC